MAARRGTSRDRRVDTPCRSPTWAPRRAAARPLAASPPLARTLRRAAAPVLATTLVACQPPVGDPERELPGSSSAADPSAGSVPLDPSITAGTTDSGMLDTGEHPPDYPSPDCAYLLVPGPTSDVAATPRPDHDAEVLALSIDPTRAAAPQARYDVVTADLAAIRALDPSLAQVHVGCAFPNGIAFWFFDDEAVNDALFADDYHAWDCHNAYFHHTQTLRIDGLAVAIELDGVFGEAVGQAYAGLPGLGDQAAHWFQRDDWPVPTQTSPDCTPTAGSLTLTATLLPTDALDQRDYRFERTDGTAVVYRVTPREPPQPLR
jgi:hypothetical protein